MHKHHRALGLATAPPVGVSSAAEIAKLRPVQPVTLLRPHAARRAARFFIEKFPGRSLYAVKANPSPELLELLWAEGVTHYDVASLGEVKLVAETLPGATMCFMHPVKAEEAIGEAYFTHGVRTFSLDTLDELDKILRATATGGEPATDLNLVDIVDVGGGFPSTYPGMEPPPLETYFDVIHRTFEALPISYSAELWCEPGRALCAEYASVLVRVEKRRGAELYINDGAYGALFDAAHIGWRYPVALVREEDSSVRPMAYSFYGPTCDDLDHMAGPFELPADVQPGDYIEVGMLGAYGCAMRTVFNGFTVGERVIVEDEPMASLYGAVAATRRSNVVKL
ncbi:MAG: type III PLP-dependent enzyme [Sphingomonadales bacterium]|nr:type III PLP-dependent enzyme [Sphingomonadales bacterium]